MHTIFISRRKRLTTAVNEKISSLSAVCSLRPVVVYCMAGLPPHLPDLCCLRTLVMAGAAGACPKTVLWLGLPHHVHLESGSHLVDLECLHPGGHWRHPGQQPHHVSSVDRLPFY